MGGREGETDRGSEVTITERGGVRGGVRDI